MQISSIYTILRANDRNPVDVQTGSVDYYHLVTCMNHGLRSGREREVDRCVYIYIYICICIYALCYMESVTKWIVRLLAGVLNKSV